MFHQIATELEKCLLQQRDQFDLNLPCPIEAAINYAIDGGEIGLSAV